MASYANGHEEDRCGEVKRNPMATTEMAVKKP